MENILVIGGGLMGNSVSWKLAEQGEKVLLLEQQGEKYDHGSSHGHSRISRSLGPKNNVFSFVHNRTVKEVKGLIHFLNEDKSSIHHSMEDIYNTSPVSYLYKKNQYKEIRKLKYKKQKGDYKKASGDTAFRKFGVTLDDDQVLVREYRQYSGTMNPLELIKKLRLGIAKKGGQIKYKHKVVNLIKKKGVFEVDVLNIQTNKRETISAKKVVVAAGPYTNDVLKDFAPYFNKIIRPQRVNLSYFKIADERYEQFSAKEIKNISAAHPIYCQIGKEYFSMIEKGDKNGSLIFKAGGHQIRRNIIDIDKVWDLEVQKKELKWVKKQFRKHFEMLEIFLDKKDIELVKISNCVYSVTKTEIPLVTNILNKHGILDKDIVVIGGMCGIGAKGCLGYGVIGANLILGKKGESSKTYHKALKTFGNPLVRLQTKKVRRSRLF